MHPFECINEACKNLIIHKGLQIMVESMQGEADADMMSSAGVYAPYMAIVPTQLLGIPIKQRMSYNVAIRLLHNFSIDLVFSEDDFNPTKSWGIEKYLKLDGMSEDDKQIARFMYFFWELSKYIKTPRADTGPLAEFIFCRTRTIRQTL